MRADRRVRLFALICGLCLLVSVGYVWARARETAEAIAAIEGAVPSPQAQADIAPAPLASAKPATASAGGGASSPLPLAPAVLFRSTALGEGYGQVAALPLGDLAAPRTPTGLRCERVYFAGGHGMCLSADRGAITSYYAVLFGPDLKAGPRLPLQGIPSRTRLSPDGRYASVTVFVSGHSYAPGSFSTRTEIYDTVAAGPLAELEEFTVERDGKPFREIDFNFWGVTFAADGNRFYATLATRGENFLIEGDVAERHARVIHRNVECPSLSPDGSRIAFKRPQAYGWRIFVLDLATGEEWQLAETRNVDDQVEWLDDDHILYSVGEDIWVAPADGTGEPAVFLADASSPAVLR